MATPSESTVENLQPQIEYNFYGAVTAARAVLPAMREAGAGTLLFTTGGGSINPVPMLGNVNAAAGALRNWVLNLHNELAGSGVYAAHVAISTWIGDDGPEGIPAATPDQIAPLYWDLHERRDQPEAVFTGSLTPALRPLPTGGGRRSRGRPEAAGMGLISQVGDGGRFVTVGGYACRHDFR
ncbi:SDR family NAD(P)-dependent oxidoreductase [Streptomyces sp. NPDC050597]|uniref:SDR family NAD(P)-dependent oxidoreductase n=1 Tax=unclassified Streptomyces TaxID=2593676 RepID=UPI002E2CA078|nr:SDR family NAD(P)-dependent oxidoreductase [Streptomyces sp. NBC_00258]